MLWVRAVNHQRRGEDNRGRNLMSPGSLPPPFTKMDWRVIAWAGEKSRERQSRIVHRTQIHAAIFEAANRLARQLVGPRPRFAGGFIRPVELNHDFVLRRTAQYRLI